MKLKADEIRKLSIEEIIKRINDAREELMNFRFQQATGELTDHTQIRLTRRTIARLTTILNERVSEAVTEGEQ
jgi:large subunit ribosomal protein L29